MEAISKKTLSKILSLILFAVLVFSLCVPFSAEGTDVKKKVDYDFKYEGLADTNAGEAGYIEVHDDGLIVNRNGMTSEVRFFGIEYDMSKNGIPEGENVTKLLEDVIAHGYNLIVLKDVYKVLKNPDNFKAFDYFLKAVYDKKSVYLGLEMFTEESLGTTSGGLLYDNAALARAKTFFKKFFTRKNLARSNKDINFYYYQDTSFAFIKLFDDFDISKDVALYGSLKNPFNDWLYEKYGNVETLAAKWINAEGVSLLAEGENPVYGTVNVPSVALNTVLTPESTGFQREADFGIFLAQHTEKTFKALVSSIRAYGFRSPILLSDNSDSALNSRISGCGDVTYGELNYTDGMTVGEAIGAASKNAIGQKPHILKWNSENSGLNKVTELFNLAVYSSYQGWDVLIVGEYSLLDTDVTAFNKTPELWNQAGLAATFFRHRAIAPSFGLNFGVAYSDYDMVMNFGNYGYINNISSLISRTSSVYYGEDFVVDPKLDAVMSAGNSAFGNFKGAASTKDNGTKVIIQSIYPYQDASFNPSRQDKSRWYNDQGIISTKDRFTENIGGLEVYFGEGKAIIPDGYVDSVATLAKLFDRLNLTSFKNEKDNNDVACYTASDLIVSDNSRLYYTPASDSVVGFGSRFFYATGDLSNGAMKNVYDAYLSRYYYNSTTEEDERDIKVSVSDLKVNGADANGTIAIYALGDGVNNEDANEFVVYTKSSDPSARLTGTVKILRENTEIEAYGLNFDTGLKADKALVTTAGVTTGTDLMTVQLDGNYDYYIIKLKEAELDAALKDYDPNESIPPRQNLFWYIVIPAVFFLIVVYSGILISDNLKVKRAERLRVATRKATLDKTGHYASALDVPDGDKGLRPDDVNSVSGRSKGTPGSDIFAETEEERHRRENPWEREDGTVDYTKIVRSDDDDENAW